METWKREMDWDKDRNRNTVTGPDVQEERDMDNEEGD